MSRSFRKTPITGVSGDSDKDDKVLDHRRARRVARHKICKGDYESAEIYERTDPWDWCKDGKLHWFNEPCAPPPCRHLPIWKILGK